MSATPRHDAALGALVDEVAELRPLPAVALEVLQLSEEERFSAHDLAALIAADPALSAKVLRIANSAYYGFPRRISSVRDAVVLVGFRAVRSAAVVSCVMDSIATPTLIDAERFWRHAVGVGEIAQLLAREERVPQEHAFTAGVLHKVGLLALDQHRNTELARAVAEARRRRIPLVEAERLVLGFDDAAAGAALAERWGLPDPLVEAIAAHATTLATPPVHGTLAACVVRARLLARASGLDEGIGALPADDDAVALGIEAIAAQRSGPVAMPDIALRAGAFVAANLA